MKSPKNTKEIKAKLNKFLCPYGFAAITLFGIIYVRKKEYLWKINRTNKIDSILENHEMIHIRQAWGTKNSWFIFYLLYIWQWICNLPLFIFGLKMPYRFIEFELEATCNELNFSYNTENPTYGWKKYKKLTFCDKWKMAKEFKKSKSFYFKPFVRRKLNSFI